MGAKVVYSKYAGTELTISNKEHVLLKARCLRAAWYRDVQISWLV